MYSSKQQAYSYTRLAKDIALTALFSYCQASTLTAKKDVPLGPPFLPLGCWLGFQIKKLVRN